MIKCLKITLKIKVQSGLLSNFIQKNAKNFGVEGTVQAIDKETVKIVVCGENKKVDDFIDSLYQGFKKQKPSIVEVEPFLKDKEYRGVFRIIE